MPWHEKYHTTPFDAEPPRGLFYFDGDLLSKRYGREEMQGKKYPVITYPSGLQKELRNSSEDGVIVNIFGALELLRNTTRDEGFSGATDFASEYGYTIAKGGENNLIVINPYSAHGYTVTYDNNARTIINIKRFPQQAMEILDAESRAILPELYSNEHLGMEAVAPVKFFMPDGGWTWYPTEYDGEDTFFGLVSGFEVELGYFSLTELEGIRGSLGLSIERDLYFKPTDLRTLQTLHHS